MRRAKFGWRSDKMKFNLALNDVEKLLQDYYQKTIDSKAKIQIDVRKKQYGICGSDWMADPCVTLSLEGKVSGIPVTMTEDVTESVPTILKNIITDSGYIVKEVNWNAGIKPVTTGYGMTEKTDWMPYCDGLVIEVKTKQKVLGGV